MMKSTINNFRGNYFFLSNFYIVDIQYERMVYPSIENAYQAAKTKSLYERVDFLTASPSDSKKIGRRLMIRQDWENVKYDIMEELLKIKFSYPDLRLSLRLTGDAELVEGNYWHDNEWGDCFCEKCFEIVGKNHLGRLLTNIREGL